MTTVLTEDGARDVAARYTQARPEIATADLSGAIGWQLKPEGLCRGDVCVPVKNRNAVDRDGWVDMAAVADALGRPVLIDQDQDLIVLGVAADARRRALDQLDLPEISLPDLTGRPRSFAEWTGRKKLLIAFSSW